MADSNSKSFIENVNSVANGISLAFGDVVEDTQTARDEAVAAALNAKASETSATDSEEMARKWSENGHNNPVQGSAGIDAEYSSYHWATEASLTIGDPLINDNIISAHYTWSSQKVSNDLAGKSDTSHTHAGVYEPAFTKMSAFNKNFSIATGDNGSSKIVARADHKHTSLYEPKRQSFGTAYNKDFGSTSGTVAEGDHIHNGYEPKRTTNGTAYNKNFTIDSLNLKDDEIPRATHTHKAERISYDNSYNSGSNVITSTTVQGGMEQLDNAFAAVTVAEKCKIVAGMANASYTVPIAAAGEPVKIITAMTVSTNSKNALHSGGDVVIDYDEDPLKLVEGWFTTTVTILALGNTEYALYLMHNGNVIDTAFRNELGSSDKDTTGTFSMSLTGFVSALKNGDKISVALSNETSTADIEIRSHTISFAGEPEGALVASGVTMDHEDILSRDVPDQHPMSSIYETGNKGTDLDTVMLRKADKITTIVENNLLSMDASGNLKDSGISSTSAANHMSKVATPTLDHIVVMDSQGESKDGGLKIDGLALAHGDGTKNFSVSDSTSDIHAVNQGQLNAAVSNYTLQSTFDTHEAASNPHNTTYSDVGAAPTTHTHTIAQVNTLQDELDSKYDKLTTAVTNNLASFGAGNVILDSGMTAQSTLLEGEAV
jgi:hypothetical protein